VGGRQRLQIDCLLQAGRGGRETKKKKVVAEHTELRQKSQIRSSGIRRRNIRKYKGAKLWQFRGKKKRSRSPALNQILTKRRIAPPEGKRILRCKGKGTPRVHVVLRRKGMWKRLGKGFLAIQPERGEAIQGKKGERKGGWKSPQAGHGVGGIGAA